ncbi:MAG TPA: hypothetical protein VHY09_10700 [Candidatus Methylacidiphilales bacterium]|jgi:hypothetical protein|nr:hypothetical protein [Candidatus Methylacidiphilales bacterium]
MSTLTKSRRMPAKYRVRAGGITEIVYSATPEVIVVLPGTRWLEQRREREARLAAEAAERIEETQLNLEENAPLTTPMIDTELADLDFAAEEISPEDFCQPDELGELELTWTDRMRIASTKLIKRQNLWLSSLRG